MKLFSLLKRPSGKVQTMKEIFHVSNVSTFVKIRRVNKKILETIFYFHIYTIIVSRSTIEEQLGPRGKIKEKKKKRRSKYIVPKTIK